jgi:hypothetical protein
MLVLSAMQSPGKTPVRDKGEGRAFYLLCCTLLNALVRKSKGPQGRSRPAG